MPFPEYASQPDTHTQSPHSAAADDQARAEHSDGPCLELGETPEDNVEAEVGAAFHEAAGIPAIVNTLKYGVLEMGAARSLRTFVAMNKLDGFDCQSCAWPSPDTGRKLAEFCENGAKAVSDELTHRRVGPKFFADFSVQALLAKPDYWLNAQGRLVHPMLRRQGSNHFEPVAWEEAFALIGSTLRSLATPDEAIFYTSGKTCNEAAFLFQLLARQFGTNNLPDCSNMCHESSGTALTETLGVGKGTVTLEDFERCDTILILGSNPGTNHPRMLTSLEAAKRRGATIVAINPMPETGLMRVINPNPQDYSNPLKLVPALLGSGTQLADLHIPVRVNGDAALLQGIMKSLFERERAAPGSVLHRTFIEERTTGFVALQAGVDASSWEEICESSGVDRELIERVAAIVARAQRLIAVWCLGLTQHPNGVENVEQVINLLLLGGHIGRPGAGACCVRGHSNVQGDRTMGVWERPRQEFLAALDSEFGIHCPRKSGCDSVESLHLLHEQKAKVFVAISGNLLQAAPDTHYAATGFRTCPLVVHVSTKLHRGHLVGGQQALILPCLGRAERDLLNGRRQLSTTEDSMGIINPSSGTERPASEQLRSDVAIIVGIAEATFGRGGPIDWQSLLDHDRVRDHIGRVIPGFEDFNARIRKGFFYLPNGARHGVFHTPTGKAKFSVCRIPQHGIAPNELLMTTVRSHDQFNTTIYGLDDRYRGIYNGRRVILMNAEDIRALGLSAGTWVDIASHFEGETRTAHRFKVVAFPIARKCAATYFPEANVLIPVRSVAARSNQPAHKCIRITLSVASRHRGDPGEPAAHRGRS
jgi:molybdopterin-dependent oxidoreductase alpha subunit